MINVFVLQNGRLNQVPINSRADLENVTPVWVDLHDWDGNPDEFRRPFIEHGTHVFVSDIGLDDPLRR